jgi:hypothetical protein
VEAWEAEEPHCRKSLLSNAELVVRHSPAINEVSTEAEEAMAWEAVTRQPVKTWHTEKN